MERFLKHSLISFVTLGVIITPTIALAETPSTTSARSISKPLIASPSARKNALETKKEEQKNRLESNQQAKITNEIDRRLKLLNNLLDKINKTKKLSASDKASLSSLVQTQITELTTLKTTIASETEPAKIKELTQTLTKDHQIFAFIVPRIELLIATDSIIQATEKLNTLATKLDSRIQQAQSSGQDTTMMQSQLTEMKAKTASASTIANQVHDSVLTLTPEGFPGNKSTLQSARTQLKTAHQNVVGASQNARKIVQLLKVEEKPVSTSSASPKI